MTVRMLRGDCRAILPTLPANSVHCVVCSPPYYGLRDPKWKLPAAIALLDRGFGKPVQQLVGDPNTPIAFEIVWGPAREPQAPVIEANAEETTEIADAEVVWGSSSDAPSD